MTARRGLARRIGRLEAIADQAAAERALIVVSWADIVAAARNADPVRSAAMDAAIGTGDLATLDSMLGTDPPSVGGRWADIVVAARQALRCACARNAVGLAKDVG